MNAKLWDTKTGRATGRCTAVLETNRILDKIRVKIDTHYQKIMDRDNFVTVEKVKNAFSGLEHRQNTLLKLFEKHKEDYEKYYKAGMKSKSSYQKYLIVYKHLKEFLYQRYQLSDIALKELTLASILKTSICSCVWISIIAIIPYGFIHACSVQWYLLQSLSILYSKSNCS